MPCVGTVVRIRGVLRMLRGCLPVNELPAMNGPTVAATQEWDAMPVDRKTIWDGPLEGHGTGSDDNSIRLSQPSNASPRITPSQEQCDRSNASPPC
jgi:hypothetical protein